MRHRFFILVMALVLAMSAVAGVAEAGNRANEHGPILWGPN